MVLELFRRDGEFAVFHISSTLFGVFYVGWLGSHIILLRLLGEGVPGDDVGGFFVLLAFALAWGADTGAYFTGHAFGRRKLLPRVSPNKSVEGAVGGVVFGVVVAFVAKMTFAGFLAYGDVAVLGFVSPVMAALGDLVESLMKRDVRIKDTSHALPGHGGMLDRFDSVLFVAPFVYYYLRFILPRLHGSHPADSEGERRARGEVRIVILGSTGSIGTGALSVVEAAPDDFDVVARSQRFGSRSSSRSRRPGSVRKRAGAR